MKQIINTKTIQKFFILIFVSFIPIHSSAQRTYIDVCDMTQSTWEMCDEFRELWNKNDAKVLDIANSFILLRNNRLINLVPFREKTLLSYYFYDFDGILYDVKNGFDYHYWIIDKKIKRPRVSSPHYRHLNCYPSDALEKVLPKKDSIISKIQESAHQPDEKDFLILYLKSILEEKEIIPEQMNRKCDDFLANHYDSEYALYVNRILNLEYKTRNIGFAAGVFFGYNFLGGNISNYIKPQMSIGGYFDIAYKRFILKPDIAFSIPRYNKNDFNYQDIIYSTDSTSSMVSGNLNLGYFLWDNSHFRVTPFLGIGKQALWISSKGKEDIEYKANFTIGAELEWKFFHSTMDKSRSYHSHFYNPKDKANWSLFLRFGYSNLNFSDPLFAGSMFYIKVGIGFFQNPAKRVYK